MLPCFRIPLRAVLGLAGCVRDCAYRRASESIELQQYAVTRAAAGCLGGMLALIAVGELPDPFDSAGKVAAAQDAEVDKLGHVQFELLQHLQ